MDFDQNYDLLFTIYSVFSVELGFPDQNGKKCFIKASQIELIIAVLLETGLFIS